MFCNHITTLLGIFVLKRPIHTDVNFNIIYHQTTRRPRAVRIKRPLIGLSRTYVVINKTK